MRLCVDIDGTILMTEKQDDDYIILDKNYKIISIINDLYNNGHTVILHTGRHWDKLQMTIDQLHESGVLYDSLTMGKPTADFYIDDKGISPAQFVEKFGRRSH